MHIVTYILQNDLAYLALQIVQILWSLAVSDNNKVFSAEKHLSNFSIQFRCSVYFGFHMLYLLPDVIFADFTYGNGFFLFYCHMISLSKTGWEGEGGC
jgi:hypothetical protein